MPVNVGMVDTAAGLRGQIDPSTGKPYTPQALAGLAWPITSEARGTALLLKL